MGELIRREASQAPKEFSGERLTGAASGQVHIEHYHRYVIARHYCRGLDVLDVAAGEGYGSALIAQVAKSVVGIEINADCVIAAREDFQYPNLKFEQGDARSIPLPDGCIDVVVSFETLEHFAEQRLFVAEIKRVLRKDGFVIISTPDSLVYSPMGSPPNPYHVLELTKEEFSNLLLEFFENVEICSQRALIGSVVLGRESDAPILTFENRGNDIIEANETFANAQYLIAFASNGVLPKVANSVFVSRNDLDTDFLLRIETTAALKKAEAEILEAQARVVSANERADSAARLFGGLKSNAKLRLEMSERRTLRAEQKEREARLRADQAEQKLNSLLATVALNDDARLQLDRIHTSTIWRMTGPARAFGRRFPRLAKSLGRVAKVVWWTVTLKLYRRFREWRQAPKRTSANANLDGADNGNSLLQEQVINRNYDTRPLYPSSSVSSSSEVLQKLSENGSLVHQIVNRIIIKTSDDPIVSIIIPTFGQFDLTRDCLQSILDNMPMNPIEIIVVDDAYAGPENIDILKMFDGIRLIRNEQNCGYLRSCNSAAAMAKAPLLYFLNNDTKIHAGTIDSLVKILDERNDVGIVGSKLIFPDGVLQEAGGIIWDDASAWNFGRGASADRPEFNYVREADYCSGASMMIRNSLFQQLGGFDEAFLPAYYEDCDLAFRSRAKGFKVIYQPRSVVTHREGASHGTDLTRGIKRNQITNQQTMANRWSEILNSQHFQNGTHVMRARDRAHGRRIILIIDHYTLEPDRDAGSRSVMGIVEALLTSGWVVKFWPVNRAFSAIYTSALEDRGVEVIDSRWQGDLRDWFYEFGQDVDHVLVNRPNFAIDHLVEILPNSRAVLSYYGVDLHYNRIRRQASLDHDLVLELEADEMEKLELAVWPHFDVVIYPSDEEARIVRKNSPYALACSIIPFCVDERPNRLFAPKSKNILFVAGFAHPPNVDAAIFLVKEILPKLREKLDDFSLTLAGSNPTEAVRALAGHSIRVTGYISDEALQDLYLSHRVSAVPLRFGAGVKGKVIESLSYGLPIVTTEVGVEGIPGLRNLVPVHSNAAEIAESLLLLLLDDERWLKQSLDQQQFVRQFYSREAMQRSVVAALELGEAGARNRIEAPDENKIISNGRSLPAGLGLPNFS